MKFDWENPHLYKGQTINQKFYKGILIGLILTGVWFTFGGHTILWHLIERILHI